MSTKTLRKRIALVAVSALGAGLLSVVAVPSANAAAGDLVINTSGSVGLLASDETGTTTKTAVLLSSGTLVISSVAATLATPRLEVSAGAAIISATGGTLSTDQTYVYASASGTNITAINIKPTGAVGSTFTVTTRASNSSSAAAVHVVTVTIAGSSESQKASVANSRVNWATSNTDAATTEVYTSAATTYSNPLYLYINLRDAYYANVTSTSGALVVTASTGAKVGTPATTGSAASGTGNTSVSASSPEALWVVVTESTVGAGWAGTITVSYNGVTIATKAGKITGAPASVTLAPLKIGKTGGTATENGFTYIVKDAAGNGLAFSTASALVYSSSSNTGVISAANGNEAAAYGNLYGDYVGRGNFTCILPGKSDVVLQYTLPNGTVIKSNSITLSCGGDAYEYSAAWDKASYVQGEIATLTVSFKDDKGNAANSVTAVDTITSGATDITLSTPMLTLAGSTYVSTGSKLNKLGQKVYTFTVGTTTGLTEGSYQAVVSFPTIDVPATAGYKVTTGSAGVTNADVLKAIVSLIASINKQIAALQKALLKK
jgi:hypothetical protein